MENQIPTLSVLQYEIEDGVLTLDGVVRNNVNGDNRGECNFTVPLPFIRMHYHSRDSREVELAIEGGIYQTLKFGDKEDAAKFHNTLTNELMDFYSADALSSPDDDIGGHEPGAGVEGRDN